MDVSVPALLLISPPCPSFSVNLLRHTTPSPRPYMQSIFSLNWISLHNRIPFFVAFKLELKTMVKFIKIPLCGVGTGVEWWRVSAFSSISLPVWPDPCTSFTYLHSQVWEPRIIPRMFARASRVDADPPGCFLLTYTQSLTLLEIFSQAKAFNVSALSRFLCCYVWPELLESCQHLYSPPFFHSLDWASGTHILYRLFFFFSSIQAKDDW